MQANLSTAYDPPVGRIRIAGELDVPTGRLLRRAFRRMRREGCVHVEFDLADVTFVDAYTLRLFDLEQRRLRSDRGDLVVVAASDRFRSISNLAGYAHPRPGSELKAIANGTSPRESRHRQRIADVT